MNWLRGLGEKFRQCVTGKEIPERARIGALGERAAEAHLRREKKFSVVVRNWRHGRDEIDLVCLDRGVLVFVEVKTRSARALVSGYFTVEQRKKAAILRATRAYISGLREKPITVRFDIVEARSEGGAIVAVQHFENVPLFPKNFL